MPLRRMLEPGMVTEKAKRLWGIAPQAPALSR